MLYPPHITDSTRIKIGQMFIQKRLRKQFPSLKARELEKLDRDVTSWIEPYSQKSISDFWDTVYAFKFETAQKYWVNYLTAENVRWSLREVGLDDVLVNWPGVFSTSLDTMLGPPPYTRQQIVGYISDKPELKKAMIQNSDEHSQNTPPRDHYPVVGMARKGKVSLEDGNRRTFRKILYGADSIQAWVGEFMGDSSDPINYWISTGWFWQFVLVASRDPRIEELGRPLLYKDILNTIFEQSEVARITYDNSVSNGFFAERNPLAVRLFDDRPTSRSNS